MTTSGQGQRASLEVFGREQRDETHRPADDVSVREFLTTGARKGLTTDQMFPDDAVPVVESFCQGRSSAT